MADDTAPQIEDPDSRRSARFPFDIDIAVNDPAWDALLRDVDIERVIGAVWSALETSTGHGPKSGELSLAFVDDAAIAGLNKGFRGKDGPTNVLSFPTDDNLHMLGDIVMAYETVLREATESAKPVAHHITHLLVHGFLHLHGYDHMTEAEAQVMETLETAVLSQLGIDNPYEIRKA